MKDKHKYIIMTITIVMGALLYIWQFIRDANSCQDAIAPRSIASSTQFNHLWSIDNLYIQTYKDNWGMVSNTLFTNNKDAFAIGAVESCEEHLLAVNSRGEISSIFTLKSSGNNRVTNILNDDLNLYTAYSSVFRVSGDDELGAGGIASYDLKSGQQNWDTPIPGARTIEAMFIDRDIMTVGGIASNNYYILDVRTGQILSTISKKEMPTQGGISALYFALWKEFVSGEIIGNKLTPANQNNISFAIDKLSTSTSSPHKIYYPIEITSNKLIVRDHSSRSIRVLNATTLDEIWETPSNVVSNIAVNKTHLFYITNKAKLVVFDLGTGAQVGYAQFSPASIERVPLSGIEGVLGGTAGRSVLVTAKDNNEVFVYFGDSLELFAFKFISS